jgi:hypothetical protein
VAHQEAVAEVLAARGIVRARSAVEHAQRDLAPTIGHVEEQTPIAASERAQNREVGRALHVALSIPGRPGEVHDALVHAGRWMHGEVERADDLLVGAGGTEGSAAENGLASVDLESRHRHDSLPRPQRAAISPTTLTRVRSELPGR